MTGLLDTLNAAPPVVHSSIGAVLGLVIGSFLNVCIHRLPQHRSVVTPRSYCPSCRHTLAWTENVPLISFLLQRGRCRHCKAGISWRYPLVELLTAILFAAILFRLGITAESAKWLLFVSLMIVLFWTDLEYRLLPDALTWGGMAAGIVFAFVVPLPGAAAEFATFASAPWRQPAAALLSAVYLTIPFWLVTFGYARLRKITPPGWGDVKLLGTLGAFLGIEQAAISLLAGSVAGSVIGLSYVLLAGKDPRTYRLPLGSFLAAGALAVFFWNPAFSLFGGSVR